MRTSERKLLVARRAGRGICAVVLLAGLALAAPAAAGGGCEVTPCHGSPHAMPGTRMAPERVMVRPPVEIAHRFGPEFRDVVETHIVKPPRTVARHVEAEYATVKEKVMVKPPQRVWVQGSNARKDCSGGCWVMLPAEYQTLERTVLVREAGVVLVTEPAVTAPRIRRVMLRAPGIAYEQVPAVYETRYREVPVSPRRQPRRPLK